MQCLCRKTRVFEFACCTYTVSQCQCGRDTECQSNNRNPTLRTHNQFCTTEKLCNHRSLTWEFRQKNNDRQMNGELRQCDVSGWPTIHQHCLTTSWAPLMMLNTKLYQFPILFQKQEKCAKIYQQKKIYQFLRVGYDCIFKNLCNTLIAHNQPTNIILSLISISSWAVSNHHE